MSFHKIVKNSLNELGFTNVNIKYSQPTKIYSCIYCGHHKFHIGKFDCCDHFCCTDCLDFLYDNYNTDNVVVLFHCPFCKEKVKEIQLE